MSIQKINEAAAVFGQYDGPILDFKTPQGFSVTIREWNGEDEDAISKLKDNEDGTAICKFVAGIIFAIDGKPVQLTWEEVAKWRVRTIYYILFKSRVFTYGKKVTWEHTFEKGEVVAQIEDLSRYDWDLSKGNPPKKGEVGYSPDRIVPYETTSDWVESTTSTGKKYRFKHRTGEDEIATRTLDIPNLTVNDKLRIRSFQLFTGSQWVEVQRFNVLRAIEANEIRNKVDELDSEFLLATTCKSPSGAKEQTSLISVPDFFFPQS